MIKCGGEGCFPQ